VLIITFDEWGGFFEHVAPPRAVAPNGVDSNLVNGEALLGFRVPTVIASPFTRRAHKVDPTVYDHTAILKLIEWRWGLSPLTLRDASPAIGNPVTNFNFASRDAGVPSLPKPGTVPALPCVLQGLASRAEPSTTVQVQATTEFHALGQSDLVKAWLTQPQFRNQQ
jgi:phospholipase C